MDMDDMNMNDMMMDHMDINSMMTMGMHMNHSMHMMKMYFHTGFEKNVIFLHLDADSSVAMFGICVLIMVSGILYEGLKNFRIKLHSRDLYDRSVSRATLRGGSDKASLVTVNEDDTSCCASVWQRGHLVQTSLHMLQTALSYTLMLVFMTFNLWLCLALVLGIGIGYFLFGWNDATNVEGGDHCH